MNECVDLNYRREHIKSNQMSSIKHFSLEINYFLIKHLHSCKLKWMIIVRPENAHNVRECESIMWRSNNKRNKHPAVAHIYNKWFWIIRRRLQEIHLKICILNAYFGAFFWYVCSFACRSLRFMSKMEMNVLSAMNTIQYKKCGHTETVVWM